MAVKKVLVVTPKFPYPPKGACELDRASGIEMLIAKGFEVQVITKVYDSEHALVAKHTADRLGIKIMPIAYKNLSMNFFGRLKSIFTRVIKPWYLDGAAFEYADAEIQTVLKTTLDSFKPDVVWFDYTYLWPLYKFVRRRNIPIVTRSINFEPNHFLEEDGRSLINYFKFLPKLLSEYLSAKWSAVVFAITPSEEAIYKKIGAPKVVTLPLRSLSRCVNFKITEHVGAPLQVFFMGSTYNVAHNLAALRFLLLEIVPRTEKMFPGRFQFNIFGAKIPESLKVQLRPAVSFVGHVPFERLDGVLSRMDIAVVPSLYGAGMQQKIFEPITRGFSTVVSPRGLAGYPFKNDEHLLLASTGEEFANSLGRLLDVNLRRRLSSAAKQAAAQIFSSQTIEKIMFDSSLGVF